jgi:hypothetical protein
VDAGSKISCPPRYRCRKPGIFRARILGGNGVSGWSGNYEPAWKYPAPEKSHYSGRFTGSFCQSGTGPKISTRNGVRAHGESSDSEVFLKNRCINQKLNLLFSESAGPLKFSVANTSGSGRGPIWWFQWKWRYSQSRSMNIARYISEGLSNQERQ